MTQEEILNKISKVQRLSNEGVDGERENAEVLLAYLLNKYNITEDQLVDDEYDFQAYGVFGPKLFTQICVNVCGYEANIYR